MALFKSTVITSASGKMGGAVFSKSRSGNQIKPRRSPSRSDSPRSQEARGLIANLSNAWRSLTLAQQEAWNTAAIDYPATNTLGDTFQLSGQSLFMRLNWIFYTLNNSVGLFSPLAPIDLPSPTITASYDLGAGIFSVGFTPDPVPTDVFLGLSASRPLSSGNVARAKYKLIGFAGAPATTASPLNVTGSYLAKFGGYTVQAGNRIIVEARLFSLVTGQRSASFTELITVT